MSCVVVSHDRGSCAMTLLTSAPLFQFVWIDSLNIEMAEEEYVSRSSTPN